MVISMSRGELSTSQYDLKPSGIEVEQPEFKGSSQLGVFSQELIFHLQDISVY